MDIEQDHDWGKSGRAIYQDDKRTYPDVSKNYKRKKKGGKKVGYANHTTTWKWTVQRFTAFIVVNQAIWRLIVGLRKCVIYFQN